jgi:hypothetical protein
LAFDTIHGQRFLRRLATSLRSTAVQTNYGIVVVLVNTTRVTPVGMLQDGCSEDHAYRLLDSGQVLAIEVKKLSEPIPGAGSQLVMI